MILKFNDATQINVQQVAESGGKLHIKTVGNTPEQLRVLFTDPAKTARMTVEERGQVIGEYEGYTEFYHTEEYEGKIYGVVVNQVGRSTEERLETVEKDVEELKESGGAPQAYSAVFAMARISARDITDDTQALEVKELYDEWSGASVEYKTGEYLRYNNVLYKTLKDHTSQETWTPEDAASLYAKVLTDPSGKILPWQQPDSTNPYMTGDQVTHNGFTWTSTADNNVWEPGAVGAPWEKSEE